MQRGGKEEGEKRRREEENGMFRHRLLVQGKDDRCAFPRDPRQNTKLESLLEYCDLTSIHAAPGASILAVASPLPSPSLPPFSIPRIYVLFGIDLNAWEIITMKF